MIKHVKFAAAAVLGLSAVVGLSGQALAGISTTKHNLSTTGTGNVKSDNPEICVFCHTPHDAIKNNNITLWNHTLSTVANYGVYTSPTFNGAADVAEVGGVNSTTATATNLCLSCHDGTVALNSMNNPSNAFPVTTMSGANQDAGKLKAGLSTNLGSDLTNDHPVNFTYNTALATADGSLKDPALGLTDVKLFNGKVQCASCHDPHTSAQPTFLRATMSGSGLCLACHAK